MEKGKSCEENRKMLAEEFRQYQKAFVAMGDATRQNIFLAILESTYTGIRVGEITRKTHLSRPAVSHHLQMLKEAGVITMRREGTMNYYYVNPDKTIWGKLNTLMNHVYETVKNLNCAEENIYGDEDGRKTGN